ncbi:MAG: response regulator, partial [Deltaproteobacteria bacterium]|nr:response regulator [Deltaproteobacteria bacterium]
MDPTHSKIRVVVVDDSTVVRRFLSDAISSHPGLEVVGTASHGALAVQKLALLKPHVITMDVEMPEMSGLEALVAIRATDPTLPIIMVSSLTERGAATTLEALSLGATDYVTKPSSARAGADKDDFVKDLLAKILTLGGPRGASRSVSPSPVLSAVRPKIAVQP